MRKSENERNVERERMRQRYTDTEIDRERQRNYLLFHDNRLIKSR